MYDPREDEPVNLEADDVPIDTLRSILHSRTNSPEQVAVSGWNCMTDGGITVVCYGDNFDQAITIANDVFRASDKLYDSIEGLAAAYEAIAANDHKYAAECVGTNDYKGAAEFEASAEWNELFAVDLRTLLEKYDGR